MNPFHERHDDPGAAGELVSKALNSLTLRSGLDASPAMLGLVVVAHAALALWIAQGLEAKRYTEPVPLVVNLIPAPREPVPDVEAKPMPRAPIPVREVRRDPAPETKPQPVSPEFAPLPPPVERPAAPPEPVQVREALEPVPPAPKSLAEASVPPPPVPVVALAPPVAVAPVPQPVSPAPPVAVAPVPQPVAPAPPVAVAPAPQPVSPAPEPVAGIAELPEEITMTSQMLAAVYLRNPKPKYPSQSRRLSEQGTVLLRVFVSLAGDARRIEVKETSGYARLDKAALEAVEGWKFVPAKKGETPVAAWVIVPIRFSLKG